MRRHLIGVIGLVLVAIGLVGALAVSALIPSATVMTPGSSRFRGMMGRRFPRGTPPTSGPYGGYATPGKRIFFTGFGHAGPIARSGGFGMMSSAGCATCHGSDGRGGHIAVMMGGGIDVPDIRYSTLTSPTIESGKTVPGATDAQIAAAIRDGKDPSGGSLSAYMPRWRMDDTDMTDLLAHLKELR